MEYKKEIQMLIVDIEDLKNNPTQIVIDLFQAMDCSLFNRDEILEPIERDEIGAHRYYISCILDIIADKFVYDIKVLNQLYDLLELWFNDIENRNLLLGIPIHKG